MASWIRACVGLVLLIVAAPRVASADLMWALTGDNRLVVFGPHTPGTILRDIPITGLQTGETMHAIDFRPLDGQLYGYGSTHRIYRIHMLTGVATAISPAPLAIQVDTGATSGSTSIRRPTRFGSSRARSRTSASARPRVRSSTAIPSRPASRATRR